MNVLVFGATGVQGAAQIERLAAAGHRAIAATRHPERYAGAAVYADYADPASLRAALAGIDAIFLTLPSTSFQPAEPLIAAAQQIATAAAAAPHIRMLVFNGSMPMPAAKLGYAAQDARFEMRQRIFAAGVPAVVLAPVVFLDNLLGAWTWPVIAAHNRIRYPHPEDLAVSWICHRDLADLMIAALQRPQLAGRCFAVGGPEAVRGPDLARRLGQAWRRPLTFESQSLADFAETMNSLFQGRGALASDRLIGELCRIYQWYITDPSRPFQVDMAPVLRELPVTLSSIEEWAARQSLPRPGAPPGNSTD